MRKHEVALNKSGITFAGITTTLAVDDASALECVTLAHFHLFTNWKRYSHISYEEATPQLLSMWKCTLYVYLYIYVEVHTVCLPLYLCGSAHCMFTFISMWECILYVYLYIYVEVHTVCLPLYLCGSAHCMFTFISMWKCILYVYLYIYVEVHTVCLPLYLCYH